MVCGHYRSRRADRVGLVLSLLFSDVAWTLPPRPPVSSLIAFASLASPAPADQPTEYDVKAAFLFNFVKFVDWPSTSFANPDSPITICILGTDPFGRILDDLVQGELVNGRKVTVHRIQDLPTPRACQVVFAWRSDQELVAEMNRMGKGVLTVGEGDNFLRDGGIISFVVQNRRVRFDINRAAAEAAGLRLSSKLMSVARAIRK